MARGLLLSVTCLVAAWAAMLPRTLPAEEPTAPKIIASASDPGPVVVRLKKDDSSVVIRSAEELVARSNKPDSAKDSAVQKATEAELVKRLKVESIDWSKQMLLAVQGHPSRGEMGVIKFDPPVIEGKILLVSWKQENHVTRAAYQGPPTGFALLERYEGEVNFRPGRMTNSLGMSLLLLPAGKFLMGAPKGEQDRLDEELQHEVEITQPFY